MFSTEHTSNKQMCHIRVTVQWPLHLAWLQLAPCNVLQRSVITPVPKVATSHVYTTKRLPANIHHASPLEVARAVRRPEVYLPSLASTQSDTRLQGPVRVQAVRLDDCCNRCVNSIALHSMFVQYMLTKRNNHTIVHVNKRKIARIKWSTTMSITGFEQHSSDKITTAQTTLLNG